MGSIRELIGAFSNIFRWWIIVAPWEQAVRARLGKYVVVLNGGIHLRIPFVDKIYIQTTRRRLAHVQVQTLTTKDKKHVTVAGSIGYAIDDLLKLYDTLHQPQDTIVQEIMGYQAEYIVTHELADCLPEKLCKHINNKLQLEKYGLQNFGYIVTDFAVVKTYRLLSGDISRWEQDAFRTGNEAVPPTVG